MANVVVEDTVVVVKAVTERGVDGADGADGLGVPAGGLTGQFLTKISATDNDTLWNDLRIQTLSKTTSDDTPTELFLDGISTRLVIASNKMWSLRVLVSGRRTDIIGDSVTFDFRGSLKNVGGTVTLPGFITEIIDRTDANFNITIQADDTNDSLKITVVGAIGKAMSWKASVMIQEI